MKYYVNASVKRSGNGSAEYPFQSIQEAANIAKPGDEVLEIASEIPVPARKNPFVFRESPAAREEAQHREIPV